jgi:hypothetical protein
MNQEIKLTDAKDGKYKMELKATDVKATGTDPIAQMMGEQMKKMVAKMTVDEKGRVVEQEGSVDSTMGSGGTIFFPDKKVKVGDTWERSTPVQGQSMLAKYKFEGTENVGGKTLAKISMVPSTEGVEMKGKIDYLVDMDNGMIVKCNGKMTTSSAQGGSMVVTMNMDKI